MNQKTCVFFLSVLLSIFCLGGCLPTNAAATNVATTDSLENAVAINSVEEIGNPLPSWTEYNNGTGISNKQAIIDFVDKVTSQGPDFVEIKDRIAVFDNDGTLWAERPEYFQAFFLEENGFDSENPAPVFAGITTDEYIAQAHDFIYSSDHPDFDAQYIDLTYKPVIELVNYLKANGFKVYICSGGGVDFVRAFAEDAYGIPPEKVIGSAVLTEFVEYDDRADLVRTSILGQYNDQFNKPVGIERHIGKRPIIAVGNSGGDFEMFLYTDNGKADDTDSLIVLINHDDCQREYKYNDTEGDIDGDGEIDNESLVEANQRDNWLVVSMEHDFSDIFYSQPSRTAPSCPQE